MVYHRDTKGSLKLSHSACIIISVIIRYYIFKINKETEGEVSVDTDELFDA